MTSLKACKKILSDFTSDTNTAKVQEIRHIDDSNCLPITRNFKSFEWVKFLQSFPNILKRLFVDTSTPFM